MASTIPNTMVSAPAGHKTVTKRAERCLPHEDWFTEDTKLPSTRSLFPRQTTADRLPPTDEQEWPLLWPAAVALDACEAAHPGQRHGRARLVRQHRAQAHPLGREELQQLLVDTKILGQTVRQSHPTEPSPGQTRPATHRGGLMRRDEVLRPDRESAQLHVSTRRFPLPTTRIIASERAGSRRRPGSKICTTVRQGPCGEALTVSRWSCRVAGAAGPSTEPRSSSRVTLLPLSTCKGARSSDTEVSGAGRRPRRQKGDRRLCRLRPARINGKLTHWAREGTSRPLAPPWASRGLHSSRSRTGGEARPSWEPWESWSGPLP
jgi:hypothetical protein